jgi:hypothetical protein
MTKKEELDLLPTDDLFAAFVRRWPDCIILGQKQSAEGQYTQHRRRAGNPFTLLGLLMLEVHVTQRQILSGVQDAGDDA